MFCIKGKEYRYSCPNAYFVAECRHVLCDKEGEIDYKDQRAVAHALCGYQPFCPNARICAIRPEWRDCYKIKIKEVKPVKEAPAPKRKKATKSTVKQTESKTEE